MSDTADKPDPFLYQTPRGQAAPRVRSVPIDTSDPRGGAPADKMAMAALPLLTEDKRQAVVLLFYPPEALRDASIDDIRTVVNGSGAGILETIAQEVYKAYTSDPLDGAGARNIADALAAHARAVNGAGQ